MPDFNVCLPQPPGDPHAQALFELCELLTYSLRDLGYEATFRINDVDLSCRNIIVGCHLLDQRDMPDLPASTIVVNTEQLYDADPFGWNQNIFDWARSFETWDYSESNAAAFKRHGITGVKLLQIGHQPQLHRIKKSTAPDIDVLFYGSINDYRQTILDECRARGLEVVHLFGVYGEERDDYISRAKVVLNMHNHQVEIFEIVRVHYLLSNEVAVVSETNPTTLIPAMYRDAIASVPYHHIADECVRLVRDDVARKELQQRALRTISRFPQREFTRQLIDPDSDPSLVLSICVPTYNRARYLDCLLHDLAESIEELGFSYEVLIGDNASADGTADVIGRYQGQLNIRYFRRPVNVGVYENRSKLFAAARGRYLVYLADDDLLIPAALGRYIAHLEANPDIGAIFAPWLIRDRVAGKDLGLFYDLGQETRIELLDHHALFNLLVYRHIFPEIYVARSSLVRELEIPANPYAFVFFVQIAAMVDRSAVVFSPEPFYRQVIRYFDDEARSQGGHEEVKTGWDCYRGGVEHILARFASELTADALGQANLAIDGFTRIRMAVGLRVRTNEGSEWMENYYLASRLRCGGNDSLLPAPFAVYQVNAALEYLLGLQPFSPEASTVAYYEDDPPQVLMKAHGFDTAGLVVLRDRSEPLPANTTLLMSRHRAVPDRALPAGAVHVVYEDELLAKFP